MKPVNIDHLLDSSEDMPLCPICESIIGNYETVTLVDAYGALGLAHEDCLEEDEDEGEWWCSTCGESVPGEHVTYEETHDEACGGCGNKVT